MACPHPEASVLDNIAPPPHAFPAPYPPCCPSDPFPSTPDKRALNLPWGRRPDSDIKPPPPWDVGELTSAFAKLALGDEVLFGVPVSKRTLRRSVAQLPPRPSIGFATPCCRAPHPALIVDRPRRTSRQSCVSSSCSSSAAKQRRSSRPQVRDCGPLTPQGAPGQTISHTRRIPSPAVPYPATRTYKRTLPRRVPNNPPSQRTSEHAPSPSPQPPIPRVRISSSSSMSSRGTTSASDSDSPLSTPAPSPIPLPLDDVLPIIWSDPTPSGLRISSSAKAKFDPDDLVRYAGEMPLVAFDAQSGMNALFTSNS
ncbi:hypothetical protein BD311DRAFT_293672 [Dichomitus squalens]|uniref:Uncharacterized protein n=1 Tax=Dichomitus squalens TaxID=114155 RepID=A0A4Q9N2K6_9APHY|nr:hypothetical protein BD311DRAFT_293672 [Dichomitus squalens]